MGPSSDRAPRRRVVLFPSCLVDLLFPGSAGAARRVLIRAGCEVAAAQGATCCGQPAWNSGHVEEARRVALATLEALDRADGEVVVCSGSCTTMIHEYWPQLFEDTDHADAARRVAERAREFSSFMADDVGVDALGELSSEERVVTYHHSCHMMRGLGIKDAAIRLMARVEGVKLEELARPEVCCGFGGTFSIRYPELSSAMADEKVDDAVESGADEIVSSDVGCLMHICGRAEARGLRLKGRYIADLLDEATP